MQFRSACSGAVSVAGVTIFTTLPLQPTKCNFLRYVCGHRGGRSHDGKPEETERRDASGRVENGRGKNRGRCRIERERRGDGRGNSRPLWSKGSAATLGQESALLRSRVSLGKESKVIITKEDRIVRFTVAIKFEEFSNTFSNTTFIIAGRGHSRSRSPWLANNFKRLHGTSWRRGDRIIAKDPRLGVDRKFRWTIKNRAGWEFFVQKGGPPKKKQSQRRGLSPLGRLGAAATERETIHAIHFFHIRTPYDASREPSFCATTTSRLRWRKPKKPLFVRQRN